MVLRWLSVASAESIGQILYYIYNRTRERTRLTTYICMFCQCLNSAVQYIIIYVNLRDIVYSEVLNFGIPLCTCMDKAEVFESLGMPNFLTQIHT